MTCSQPQLLLWHATAVFDERLRQLSSTRSPPRYWTSPGNAFFFLVTSFVGLRFSFNGGRSGSRLDLTPVTDHLFDLLVERVRLRGAEDRPFWWGG